jgi:holo-[acyl-carrier protein] synthase
VIYGIGTDIVQISRIADGLRRHGERFAAKILSSEEMEEFHRCDSSPAFLAKRFAAKEAAVKALGVGFRDGISMHHIRVGHDRLGKPLLLFCGRARELCQERGVGEAFISLSDERDMAVAFVTLLRKAL